MTAPYTGKLQVEAYEAGGKAHAEGKDLEACPEFTKRSLSKSWESGWQDAAAARRKELAAAEQRAIAGDQRPREKPDGPPTRETRPAAFWPEGKPLPTSYSRPPIPCPECKRVLTDDGGRTVAVRATYGRIVYLRCRNAECRHEWKLPRE